MSLTRHIPHRGIDVAARHGRREIATCGLSFAATRERERERERSSAIVSIFSSASRNVQRPREFKKPLRVLRARYFIVVAQGGHTAGRSPISIIVKSIARPIGGNVRALNRRSEKKRRETRARENKRGENKSFAARAVGRLHSAAVSHAMRVPVRESAAAADRSLISAASASLCVERKTQM